jgi:hypothetical protein
MGMTGAGPAWRRALTGAAALSLCAVVATGAEAAPRAASRARPAAVLYYETRAPTGLLAIARLNLRGSRRSTPIVMLPNVGVFGLAVARRHLFWVTETAPADRGAIMSAGIDGRDVRTLVGGLRAPNSIVAAGGFVYWSDEHGIGRVALNGSRPRRRFVALPQERGGGVADGLASDGRHLYFSRCTEHAIGRIDLEPRRVTRDFLATGPGSCPQGLAVAGGHLYWTELGSGRIGRSDLGGGTADDRWLSIHSDQGPFQLAADAAHVYWTWGGVDGSPAFTGRVSANRSHLDRRFLRDSVYPLALGGA